ncbi:MAG: hypothetical protein QOE44_1686, partial [Solirubrobacteraceae bacterium]|nr:hypothetical protein [Solirubrobacteraceae bacterium]
LVAGFDLAAAAPGPGGQSPSPLTPISSNPT